MTEHLAKIGSLTGKKRFLLNFYGYNSIRGAKKDFNGTDKQIYDNLKNQYNDYIDNKRRLKRNANARQKRALKKELQTFSPLAEYNETKMRNENTLKYAKKALKRKIIAKRYNLKKVASSFKTYNKYVMPSYLPDARNPINHEYMALDFKEVAQYAKQVAKYTYNTIQKF